MNKVERMKKDIQLIKSDDLEKIEKRFEPETECENCYFCCKGNPEHDNFRVCILQEKVLEEKVKGCYSGYRLKEDKQ